jgi:hypothetical protein
MALAVPLGPHIVQLQPLRLACHPFQANHRQGASADALTMIARIGTCNGSVSA